MKKIFQIVLVLGVVMYTSFVISWCFGHTEYRVETVEVDIPHERVIRDSLACDNPLADRFFEKYTLKRTIEPSNFPGFFKTTIDSTLIGSYCE